MLPLAPRTAIVPGLLVDGRYRIHSRLGAGGTSEVWRAEDERLHRTVALKILHTRWQQDQMGARVEQEARAAAQIHHPSVVQIYDVGSLASGTPFVVMEYLRGRSVRELIEKHGCLSAADAVSTLLPAADALAAAHERGIIHRDIKPDNIFVCRLDRNIVTPKVVDFGVARIQEHDHKLTVAGTLVGTPAYMAPEQVLGDADLTPAVDIWGLGITIYEAVTGRMPFEGDSLQALFPAILAAPLPFPREAPDFDGDLFGIIADATRKTAGERPTAAALVKTLAAWLEERGLVEDISGRAISQYLSLPERPPASDFSTLPTTLPPPSSTVVTYPSETQNHAK